MTGKASPPPRAAADPPPPLAKPATLKDVAAAAGVSTATVSMILNRRHRFTPEVEARVRAAVLALNYHQNPLARGMATGQFGAIGLVVLDIRNPHFTNVVHGASLAAQAHGYNLIVADVKEDTSIATRTIEDLARRVDGLIFNMRLPDAIKDLPMRIGKPMVLYGQPMPDYDGPLPVPSIQIDCPRAGALLAGHFLEIGCRRIAYVGYVKSLWSGARRDAIAAGLGGRAELVEIPITVQSLEIGVAVAEQLAPDIGRYDAIVCYNDLVAVGLLHGLASCGIRVPEDVAVAGFDNIPVSCYITPSLTTVDMRSEDIGRSALERLHTAIAVGDRSATVTLLEPRLLTRASTRVLPAAPLAIRPRRGHAGLDA
jgi:LacI family transcriptional regulator